MKVLTELLAPVGSKEALAAAVESGADAVYLAGKMFGARAYAANFDHDELKEAIGFAHRRGVRVDVAVNTLVDNGEFEELAAYLRFLYAAGADAVIVQDLGAAALARQIAPGLPLHASTQMTVHDIEGVRELESLGFARVVLARELSLAEIREICAAARAEIEVFIHGALCVCYSGQCLMSGMIGGRSGNRGRCAQPCRLPYKLVDAAGEDVLAAADAGEYLLSPKDLNTIDLLPELVAAGVASFKIEGRMKRPEYVAVAVDAYRRRMDACLASRRIEAAARAEDRRDLAQIFNRDFTTAYLQGRPGRTMMSDRRPNNRGVAVGRVLAYDSAARRVTVRLAEELAVGDIVEFWVKVGGRVSVTIEALSAGGRERERAAAEQEVSFAAPAGMRRNDRVFKVFDARLMEKARGFFRSGAPLRRFAVDARVEARLGEPLTIALTDAAGFYGEAQTEFLAERAVKRPLTEESVRKQLGRLGATVYALRELTCALQGELMVPVSEINEARRRAVERLEAARLAEYARPPLGAPPDPEPLRRLRAGTAAQATRPELCVSVDAPEQAAAALRAGADAVLFGGDSFARRRIAAEEYRAAVQMTRAAGKKIFFNTPRIVRGAQADELRTLLAAAAAEFAPDAVYVHTLGMLRLAGAARLPLHADASLNVYNSPAIAFLADRGVSGVTLSPELNFTQIERIAALSALPVECIAHGNLELMVSEYCALGSFLGGVDKGACTRPCVKGRYFLLDRKGERFPLATDQNCRMHVLNGKALNMAAHAARFGAAGVSRVRIEGKYMTAAAVEKCARLYRTLLDLDPGRALPEDELRLAEQENITRGHYFRGVL